MGFRLVPKSVILSDLERDNSLYICVILPNSIMIAWESDVTCSGWRETYTIRCRISSSSHILSKTDPQQSHGLFTTAELLLINIICLFLSDRLIFNICELTNWLQIRLNVQRSRAANLRRDTENIGLSEEQKSTWHAVYCRQVQTNWLVARH